MITLTILGWLNGLTSLGLLIFTCILGLFFIYESKKTNAKLLFYLGLSAIGIGLWSLFSCLDFLTIILTGNNLNYLNFRPLSLVFPVFWLLFGGRLLYYVSLKLLIPEKKYYLLTLGLIVDILIVLFTAFDFSGNHIWLYPENPGEDLIDFYNIPGSPTSILMIFVLLLYLIFNVFGLLWKSKRSTGVVKKKFLQLSVGNLLFVAFLLLEILIPIAIVRPFMRIGEISGILIDYFAVREVPEKSEEKPAKKEVKVEDGLFRLLKRPAQITEEEVTFHREKKICLVCKGKVGGFNTYICTSCNVLYCEICAKTLANLENMCWVCDSAIDPSKPVKLYEKENGEEIKVSKEVPEKPEILDVPPKK